MKVVGIFNSAEEISKIIDSLDAKINFLIKHAGYDYFMFPDGECYIPLKKDKDNEK